MSQEEVVCKEHDKEFEMFCFEPGCKGEEVPMCSMCMCEHVKQHHLKGATHITSVVNTRLVQVDKEMANTGKQQDIIKAHHDTAEEYLKTRDAVKAQLEQKLEQLLMLYASQKELASDKNTAIMQCHEKIMKEMKKCEHKIKDKINDPKRLERKVVGMMKNHNYWKAYLEVNRALAEDIQLDDKEIQGELQKWQQLTKEFQGQLAELELPPIQLSEYKKMHHRNEELATDNERLKGRFLNCCVGELADCKAKRDTEQQQAQALRTNLEQTIGTTIFIHILFNDL